MIIYRRFITSRSRKERPKALRLAPVVLCALIALLAVGGCGVTQVLDKASLTTRGLDIANQIKEKANDGYDVREVRAQWLAAFDAFNKNDIAGAKEFLDKIDSRMAGLTRAGERIFYESAGGITVSGLVFKPPGSGPWPMVVVNHAGFGSAADFGDVGLVFRDQGYLAFVPDFRGSGESQGKIELAKGEVDDVINGIKYLKSKGVVDDDRVAMYGQSHGAAVSMLAAARYPGIKAVVAEAGPTDMVTSYKNIIASSDPAAVELLKQVRTIIPGTPEQTPEEYYVRSAINFVNDINSPILLVQGAKDPLVPLDQATRMYDALKAAGKTAELKVYPNEAHCVNDPAGRAEVWQMTLDWFRKYGV